MLDYINIGSSPSSEPCAQLGTDNYPIQARKECTAFIHQLRRQFSDGDRPSNALKIKHFDHDFGTYMEVVCYFDDADEEAINFAFRCESNTPEYWDKEAKEEMGKE
jgi:hypothetical protein